MSESADACKHACKYHGPEDESVGRRAARAYAYAIVDLNAMVTEGFPGREAVRETHERYAKAYEALNAAWEREE
jgi:hypothetical protein